VRTVSRPDVHGIVNGGTLGTKDELIMPIPPTYPGVYIEEVPSGSHTIPGVPTSVTAFIDYFTQGPINKAIHICDFGDFERTFGGLDTRSEASYSIRQFFDNGGGEAWVVRTGDNPPDGAALIGNEDRKTGLYALNDADSFQLVCIPRTAQISNSDQNGLSSNEAIDVIAAAIEYCESRRAFFIVDTPSDRNGVHDIKKWVEDNSRVQHRNAALYFPRLQIADPLNSSRPRSIGASGTMAGVYARIDNSRGFWKLPAGTEAALNGALALEYNITDGENATLEAIAINCLRTFPTYGTVAWGARTLQGSDHNTSEWRYIPVRRLGLFIEESLFRGTQWVVFEPNDELLWAQIRLAVGTFMHRLYLQGAFQGTTPNHAYFVKCDLETTTQTDIDRGVVNILIGFAPLKPAEFVLIKIQQIASCARP
jgi:phage tail sheath protein FI